MEPLDDLVRRAADGDAEAFAALFERFYEPLYRYFAARIPDRVEAEDMAAAVFVEVARGLPGFHSGGAAFIGWLFTVARHDLADAHRHHRRHRVDPVAEVPEPEAAPDVAEQVIGRLEAHRLRAALNRLTGDQRDVVLLKFAAGLSNEEVARALGKPVSAVKSLQHRALAALHRLLEEP